MFIPPEITIPENICPKIGESKRSIYRKIRIAVDGSENRWRCKLALRSLPYPRAGNRQGKVVLDM